jgi:serine/threonine-protein kinase HipA
MDRELTVHLSLHGEAPLVGRLWTRTRGARESASFEYAADWLTRPSSFAIDPELPLTAGAFHTERPLFNAFTDPAPDRWGQTLMRRAERTRARAERRTPRTLGSVDFLTLVDDATRLGALRFRDAGSNDFLATGGPPIPPFVQLGRLLGASNRIVEDEETDDDLALLLAPGTSLGGARPKASVLDRDKQLAIAKFPKRDDDWPITRWEAATLAMARDAGIDVPASRLELVLRKPVLLLRRFDRDGSDRIPFMSALTAIGAHDGEPRSYLDIAYVLRQGGSAPKRDLEQLWRRMVFNILVSNTDDHLRNHGFLHDGKGWRLSPAYDLNPMPVDVRPRVHALAIDEEDPTASLEHALASAQSFGLAAKAARAVVAEVARSVRRWRAAAAAVDLSKSQIERMATAFEHADLDAASGKRR